MITILNVNQSFLIFCSLTLSLVSCKKDVTNTVDITQLDWKVKTITIDDQIYRCPNDTRGFNAYVLIFVDGSSFYLNTSVNYGAGSFDFTPNSSLISVSYTETSEVGGQNDFDNKLLDIMSSVTSFQVLGNSLILQGDKGEVKFRKKGFN